MAEQLDFPLALKTHRADPPAAKAAAQASRDRAASNRAKLLGHLERERDFGATYREAATALGLEPAEANRRLSELRESGHVVRLEATRVPRPGSTAHIYVLPRFVFGRATA